MLIFGEKINTINKKVEKALQKKDEVFFRNLTISQINSGIVDVIDVNVGSDIIYEPDNMKWVVEIIEEVASGGNCQTWEDENIFFFVNIGDIHYPYGLENMPYLAGFHGTLQGKKEEDNWWEGVDFNLARMHQAQIRQVEKVDENLKVLFESCPENTYFIICADHGELFGEDDFFGHGPIFHELLFKVPFAEGKVRK